MTSIEVISPGPLTTIQDLGRPGWAHIGVPRSGAADRPALRLANRLVGNEEGAAALETTLAGPKLRFGEATTIAVTGAPVSGISMNTAFTLSAGEVLSVGTATTWLRSYIAFRGGIDVPLTLGSASTDILTGLGPAALKRGDELRLARGALSHAPEPAAAVQAPVPPDQALLRIAFGPREEWFTAAALELLTGKPFTVTPESNRIGLRLDGPALERSRPGELPSEGMVPGAIQVPPSGRPILLLADHPTTGGYPVIATVLSDSLAAAAQLRPGRQLRFEQISRATRRLLE